MSWETKIEDPFGPNPLNEKYDKVMEEYKKTGGTDYSRYLDKLDGEIWNLCLNGDYLASEIKKELRIRKENYPAVDVSLDRLLRKRKIEVVESERVGDYVFLVYRSIPRISPI